MFKEDSDSNTYQPVYRWRQAIQNEFRARLDASVLPFASVNHAPIAALGNDFSRSVLHINGARESVISLDATKSSDPDAGDCINCNRCVQVCPTGIDIRDGLQYECIACAACIDACDQVMDKVQLDRGLIRYSSENRDTGVHKSLKTSLLRPRILVYAVLLSAVFLGFVTSLAMRSDLQVDILRDRNALYSIGDQGRVENFYQVKLMNKSRGHQTENWVQIFSP